MCALVQGQGLVANGCREEGEVVKSLIKKKRHLPVFG